MNIKTIIAAIVALTAAPPLALASGHDREFYVGGDIGQISLNDHEDDCDALVRRYTSGGVTEHRLLDIAGFATAVSVSAAKATVSVAVSYPAADTTNLPAGVRESAKDSCEDAALAPRMVVGYKVNDIFSVEGFFGLASGFDAVVKAAPLVLGNTTDATDNAAAIAGIITGSGNNVKNYIAFTDKTEVDYTYFGLVLNGQYEVSRGMMIGGKIGIQQASADVTSEISWDETTLPTDPAANGNLGHRIASLRNDIQSRSGMEKENKTEAIYGISAAYQITDALGVRAGYDLSGVSNYMHGGVTYSLSF